MTCAIAKPVSRANVVTVGIAASAEVAAVGPWPCLKETTWLRTLPASYPRDPGMAGVRWLNPKKNAMASREARSAWGLSKV